MDANKPADPSHEMSTIGMLQGRNEMLEESIRRAQETLSAVSAQVTRQLPLLNQNVERFVETEGMPFHEAQTLPSGICAGRPYPRPAWRVRSRRCWSRSRRSRPTRPRAVACSSSGW